MSILFFYRRLKYGMKWFKLAVYTTISAVSFTILTVIALLFVACPEDSSMDTMVLSLETASLHVIMDIVLLALPLPIVFELQMPLKKKLLITGIFQPRCSVC